MRLSQHVRQVLANPPAEPPLQRCIVRPADGYYSAFVPCCVLCGQKHWHGAGKDGKLLGHRLGHCMDDDYLLPNDLKPHAAAWKRLVGRGYILVADQPEDNRVNRKEMATA